VTVGSALTALDDVRAAVRASPVDYVAWLPLQIAWLSHTGQEPALLRLGNRQGKSYCGTAELVFRCRGLHPFKEVPKAPVRCALVCMSMGQSIEIQRVLWEHLGQSNSRDLIPGIEFSSRTGFRGHKPVVEFLNGSSITIFANAQGPEAIAGAEFDYMLLDEPPAQEVYDECLARVRNTGGSIGLTLTPINGPPLPWLQKLCADGGVKDYHSRLTPASQVSPMTGWTRRTKAGRPWDAAFIEEIRAQVNPIDAPIRVDGEWESRSEGQFFECFDEAVMVTPNAPEGTVRLAIGFDYAAADRDMGMAAVLTAIEGDGDPLIYALDEVVVPGSASMQDFARAVLQMLRSRGIKWHEIDYAYGDNPVRTRFITSSNAELNRWLARRMQIPQRALKPLVLSMKRGGGQANAIRRTKDIRCRWMYGRIAADRVQVHPRCRHLTKALLEWDYGDKHPMKDVLDAWMYGLRDLWVESRSYDDLARVIFS